MANFAMKYHYLDESSNLGKIISRGDWLMMRKYNGYQAMWEPVTKGVKLINVPFCKENTGTSSGMWTIGRDNKPHPIFAPRFFTSRLPNFPVCGELHMNDSLSDIGFVRKKEVDHITKHMWTEVQFCLFNVKPMYMWSQSAEWNAKLKEGIYFTSDSNLHVKLFNISMHIKELDNQKIQHNLHLPHAEPLQCERDWESFKQLAIINNWEGIVIADLKSNYETSTTRNVLKWKREFDCEAVVKGYTPGDGKYSGMTGALMVETKWGENVASMVGGKDKFINKTVEYKVSGGLEDKDRKDIKKYYPIGKEIKLKFNCITEYGKPQHARIIK